MAKKITQQLTWISFLQNRKVCFNQERLPITYHIFRYKRLVRPKSKSRNWQGSQPLNYKAKFSQRDNIYLVDLKYNITYQNIRRGLSSHRFLYPEMFKMAEKLPYNLHGWGFYKIARFVLTKKGYQQLSTISVTKVCSYPKVNPEIEKDFNPLARKTNFSQEETMYLIDVKFNITYQNN